MITGIIHPGSGLGDSLFSYVATRVRALDAGVGYGFVGKEFFKGKSFLNLDWGKDTDFTYTIEQPAGKLVINEPHNLFDTNTASFDPEFNFIADGTVIDGYGAQDIKYFGHKLNEVNQWLQVEPLDMPDDLCVINFRGGEFCFFPELFLTKEYWSDAIRKMSEIKDMRFEVHTDDPNIARQFFPTFPIIHDISINWRSVRYAKYLIIANSAFAIFPALLNEDVKKVIAPRFWARRNIGVWSQPKNYYPKFTYL